jgi:putative ABC transport system permease protein
MTRWLLRAYGALLYLYPPDLRRHHGVEMRQCARDSVAARGARAFPRLFADTAVSVPREWRSLIRRPTMTGTGRDIWYALRLLRRNPGFSAAAIVTLALGIGANTAIFTLADATVIRPLRVEGLDRLVAFKYSASLPDYREWTARTDLFTGVAANAVMSVTVTVDDTPEPVDAGMVSSNYFNVLGVGASAGRLLGAADDDGRGELALVIDRGWWETNLHGDPAAVGRRIHVNGAPATIVGVAADGFRGTSLTRPPKLYLPLSATARLMPAPFSAPGALENRGMSWLNVIGRLRGGVTMAAAADAMDAMYARQHPVAGEGRGRLELQSLRSRVIGVPGAGSVYSFVELLAGVVFVTLLIGCANVANLQLARAAARQREIGVRLAIGAGRARIFRQVLTENAVLALLGGACGLIVAAVALRLMTRFQLPGGINIEGLPLAVNRTALGVAMLISAATVVLSGLLPAVQAARVSSLGTLRGTTRVSARSGLRSSLVAVQIALSLVLLTGTALFLQSFAAALQVPLGFNPAGVVTTTLTPAAHGFDKARARGFFDAALVKVHAIPGVTAAAWTSILPVNGSMSMTANIDGYPAKQGEEPQVYVANVGPEYFAAAGIRLLRGRVFTPDDKTGSPLVGVINDSAARRFWSGRDPLGGRVMTDDKDAIIIVGVVEDTKIRSLEEKPEPFLYAPFAQPTGPFAMDHGTLLVRTSGDLRALAPAVRDELRATDSAAPLSAVTTFEWQVRKLVMPQRMGASFFSAFALLALTLATIGIYGVASYVAVLRTREIGIRIALGADRSRIRSLILLQGSLPIVAGIAAGLTASAFASRLAAGFLRGVSPRDPLTYAAVTAVLVGVAVGATWIPARRAAGVDPIQALRGE